MQAVGVYHCWFSTLLAFTLAAGETLSHIAAGWLEGFWEALVVSHLAAGQEQENQPGKRENKSPNSLPIALSPQISSLTWFTTSLPTASTGARWASGAEPALEAGLAGEVLPKRQHPSPHLKKSV